MSLPTLVMLTILHQSYYVLQSPVSSGGHHTHFVIPTSKDGWLAGCRGVRDRCVLRLMQTNLRKSAAKARPTAWRQAQAWLTPCTRLPMPIISLGLFFVSFPVNRTRETSELAEDTIALPWNTGSLGHDFVD